MNHWSDPIPSFCRWEKRVWRSESFTRQQLQGLAKSVTEPQVFNNGAPKYCCDVREEGNRFGELSHTPNQSPSFSKNILVPHLCSLYLWHGLTYFREKLLRKMIHDWSVKFPNIHSLCNHLMKPILAPKVLPEKSSSMVKV